MSNKPTTVWWVEPNHMPGMHRIRASTRCMFGRTLEVSHLVPQKLFDSAAVSKWYVGRIIINMQFEMNEAIRGSANNDNQ